MAIEVPELQTEVGADPLSPSASSRSRVNLPEVEPLPGETNSETSPPATLGGIDQLPIDQLVRLLCSVQPRVSQAAALTLRGAACRKKIWRWR